MVGSPQTHPDPQHLLAFGLGKLDPHESSRIEGHLEECRECCDTLLNIKDDTFTSLVKTAEPAPGADTSADSERTDGAPADSSDSATMLVPPGEASIPDELPAELANHPRYEIVQLIGQGGMGNVYRARHTLMNRPVALKVINPQLMRHPQAVERFRREVQAAAQLVHPNIVTAFDAERAGDVHYLVMEFVDGLDLASVVQTRGPLPVATACDYARQAALGLQHAHEKGMVHRDIKPHNLMVSPNNQVRILDFGLAAFATSLECGDVSPLSSGKSPHSIARALPDDLPNQRAGAAIPSGNLAPQSRGALTTAGSVMGTPDYISPEQATDAHSADIRSDIYSLGCTLWYLLTGKPPFDADSVVDKLKAHMNRQPPSLQSLRPDVPPKLAEVIARMLAKDPAQRYQTPAHVAAALSSMEERKPSAKNETAWRAAPRSPRRRTAIVAAALVPLLVLAGVIFVLTDKGRIEIRSEVDDVEVVVRQGGNEIEVIDAQTGSRVRWIPSGEYKVELKEDRNDVEITGGGFTLTRWGTAVVTLKRKPDASIQAATSTKIAETARQGVAAFRDYVEVTAYLNDPRNNLGGSVPVALLGREGRVAFRFGNWLVVFEGIACDPKATILGFSAFNVPQPGTKGEGTLDFGAGDKLPAVLIKQQFEGDTNEISINNHRFKLRGKATQLVFDDETYDAAKTVQTILVARDGTTRLDGAKPAPPATKDGLVEAGRFNKHESWVSDAIVSPGGRYGISCGDDKTIRVWDIATREEKRVLKGHAGSVFGLAISTDGKLLASGDRSKSIRLWNLETGEQVGELTGHSDAVTNVAFMPDRTHLLSSGFDDTLRLWHVADRKLVRTIDIGTKVEKMLPLPDGRRVMLSGAHTRGWGPMTYDLEKGEMIDATPNVYSCMAVSADGRMSLIGSVTGALIVTDTDSGNVIVQMTDPRAKAARDAAITPDGRFAITTTRESQMHLWDLHKGKLLSSAEGDTIGTISLSPDGRIALTVGRGKGVGVWRLPESVLEPIAAAAPPSRTVAIGTNLLADPSFEGTLPEKLPQGWSTWLNDGPESVCEVVEGGPSGKHCLQIAAKGTRAVVFANSIPLDRTKRYALKGWAKFEGPESSRAIIKFSYFHDGKWLGVHDLSGVSADGPGWKLLQKTDAADAFPEATTLVATCHVEGNGTGFFDDVQLIAYPRDSLPPNFDAEHGKHNRVTGGLDLGRWVGTWQSTGAYHPTPDSPDRRPFNGVTVSRLVLDNHFLLSTYVNDAGDEQFLWLLTFDQNVAAYRYWVFGNLGQAFERAGQADATLQSLTLDLKPPAPGVTGKSVDRFLNDNRIASTNQIKGPDGRVTLEAGWNSVRKSPQPEGDLPLSGGPAAEPKELELLLNMAGEWSIHSTIKPSVWEPQGREERFSEKVEWILAGKFLRFTALDAKGQMTSLSLMTYEPAEKAYRFWFFGLNGTSGQWRITWDESSRGFHWRSIDMPKGWIGSGFNRWVDDDTFDNSALIKDDQGRVMLDSSQKKVRRK